MPLYPFVEGSLTRNLAQGAIVSGIRRGMNGAEIIGALQKSDLWYDSKQYRSDFRYWREAWEKGTKLKYSWRNEVLNTDLYMQTNWQMSAPFETVASVDWHDPITGEKYTDYVTIKHTTMIGGVEENDVIQTKTRGEIEEMAGSSISKYPKSRSAIVDRVTPRMGFYNPEVGMWG